MTVHLLDDAAGELERLALAPRLLLALDFDGTLAPIAPTPGEARLDPDARRALVELARLPRPATEVAVVSGRPASQLPALAPGADVYVGLHGLEVHEPPAPPRLRADVGESDRALARLRPLLAPLLERGARLEDKGHALAVHVRGLEPGLGRALLGEFAAAVEAERRRGAPIECLLGKAVAEARPPMARKSLAIRGLLETRGEPALFFAGDDITDEEVFEALPQALTVAVMDEPRPTAARTWVRSPLELAQALALLATCRKGTLQA